MTDLAELLHLLVCVGVQLLRDVLHPQQSSTVLGPRLLHPVHGEPRVRDGSVAERLHFLVQAAERDTQRQPTERAELKGVLRLNTASNKKLLDAYEDKTFCMRFVEFL